MTADEEKHIKVIKLLDRIQDRIVLAFFDVDSEKMLDLKITVLQELIDGKTPAEIPEYYTILENYPKEGEIWDV